MAVNKLLKQLKQFKYGMHLQEGKWKVNTPKMVIPKQMSKEETVIYYNAKFQKYFKITFGKES